MAMTEHLFHWKREPANRPRSRVREPGYLFDLSSAVDLQDGRITARVEDRHRGMRVHTPAGRSRRPLSPGCAIRIILDNHSAHRSKKNACISFRAPQPGFSTCSRRSMALGGTSSRLYLAK